MILLIFYLAGLFLCLACLATAAYTDFKSLTIPNAVSIAIGVIWSVLFALFWIFNVGVLPSLLSSFLSAALVFGITFALFSLKLFGAADSKIMTVLALWMGIHGFLEFLFYTVMAGGVLALVAIVLKRTSIGDKANNNWIAKIKSGNPNVPYGIAIAIGALVSFIKLGYFNYTTFAQFIG